MPWKAVGIPGTTSGGADALKSDAARQLRWNPPEHLPTEIVHIIGDVAPGNA